MKTNLGISRGSGGSELNMLLHGDMIEQKLWFSKTERKEGKKRNRRAKKMIDNKKIIGL